jgi:hypothetical protein
MSDPNIWAFDLEPGGDFKLSPNGGLAIVTGWDKLRQALLRELLTNPQLTLPSGLNVPGDYIFDTEYGIGINQYVDELEIGSLMTTLRNSIQQAVYNCDDPQVDTSQQPAITFLTDPQGAIYVQVLVPLKSGTPGKLIFSVSK